MVSQVVERRRHGTVGPNVKKLPKVRFKKTREIDGSKHACNDLTNFEYLVHAMNGNGSYVDLKKLA